MPNPPIFDYRITDYDRRLVANHYIADLDAGANRDAWVATTGYSIGHPGWGLIYHLMLTLLDPARENVVVETGTNLGSTALVIAQAIVDSGRNCNFHTIEIDSDVHDAAILRFAEAGLADRIVAHRGNSLQVRPKSWPRRVAWTSHFSTATNLHDHVVSEFETIEPRLRDDGAVIMDNTTSSPTRGIRE